MEVIRSVREIREFTAPMRRAGSQIALVPTMGALHDGHLSLVRDARRRAGEVIVSVFVNPTQFVEGEDFDRYPRSLEQDLKTLETVRGVRAVFAPSIEEIYPDGVATPPISLTVNGLDEVLCGRYRPNHFDGVVTVVAKLFNIVRPDVAVFGLKDAQQFVILQRMAQNMFYDVDIAGVPTVREADGLAMSSRNAYLTDAQRAEAVVLSRAIANAVRLVRKGEQRVSAIVEDMLETMGASDACRVQYAEVVDAETLRPTEHIDPSQNILIAVAAFFGETRLIDSAFTRAPAHSPEDETQA